MRFSFFCCAFIEKRPCLRPIRSFVCWDIPLTHLSRDHHRNLFRKHFLWNSSILNSSSFSSVFLSLSCPPTLDNAAHTVLHILCIMIISGGWRLDLPPQQLCRIYITKIRLVWWKIKKRKEDQWWTPNSFVFCIASGSRAPLYSFGFLSRPFNKCKNEAANRTVVIEVKLHSQAIPGSVRSHRMVQSSGTWALLWAHTCNIHQKMPECQKWKGLRR